MVVDKLLRRYIGIFGIEPLVLEKIIACSKSGVRKIWYLILLMFLWSKIWGSLGKSVGPWDSFGLKQGNHLQTFKIIHNYLILLFYHHFLVHFLIIYSSTELVFDSSKVFMEWCDGWGSLEKIVFHWVSYSPKQDNHLIL